MQQRLSLGRAALTESGKPMSETWEQAVLDVLKANRRVMSLQEIYRAMECHPVVTLHHRELWENQPKYHHWIRSTLAKLKKRGAIRHVGRGLYISN